MQLVTRPLAVSKFKQPWTKKENKKTSRETKSSFAGEIISAGSRVNGEIPSSASSWEKLSCGFKDYMENMLMGNPPSLKIEDGNWWTFDLGKPCWRKPKLDSDCKSLLNLAQSQCSRWKSQGKLKKKSCSSTSRKREKKLEVIPLLINVDSVQWKEIPNLK